MIRHYTAGVITAVLLFAATQAAAQPVALQRLTLEQTIAIALESNRDILNAKEETAKADYQVLEAASGALPQVSGFMDSQKTLKQQVFILEFPDSTGNIVKNRLKVGTDYNVSLGASLTQPLYVGGKVGTALDAARIYKNISINTLEAVQQNVVTGVVQAFNTVLLAREIHQIALESIEQAENHLANVQNLFDAGAATEYDLLRAKVNVANLRPTLIESENTEQVALLRLKEVMGVDPDRPVDIDGDLSEPDRSLINQATREVAFEHRPDLLASRENVDLYEKGIRIAIGDFLPTLSAGTTFMYSGMFDELAYHPEDWTPYWYASISLQIPLFSGFRNYSGYKQATIDHQKARTEYFKLRDATDIEVREGVMNLTKALETIESQRMNVEQAERAVELAEDQFANGRATQLEVLDAQLALDQARTNMANALYEGNIAEIALKNSLGLIDITK